MIRALFFALLLAVGSLSVSAQQTVPARTGTTDKPTPVLLAADTAKYGISPAMMRATYRDYQQVVDNQPADKREPMQNFLFKHMQDERNALVSKGERASGGFWYSVALYCQPTGHIDYVLIEPTGPADERDVARVVERLTAFYQTKTLSLVLPLPYRIYYSGAYGHPPVPRTVRTGDSTISTLEAARATTRPDTVKYVFFNQLALTDVPEVVFRFPNLEELDLSKNGLTVLPARLMTALPNLQRLSVLYNQIGDDSVFIPRNSHLRALTLQGNRLTRIPAAVRNARNLESLWMGNNTLKQLNVKAIRGMRQLVDLNFYSAGLTRLPRQIRKLKRVRVLDLYYNELTTLPKQIGKMRRLEQLAVAHNKLTALPPQLAKLKRLDTLYAHHNPLSALPTTFVKLPALRLLDLSYSRFSEFPAVLTYLNTLETVDLSGNNIQILPATVTQLTKLKQLYLRSNPVTRDDAKIGPYAKVIDQLEANKTEVFY